MSGGSITGKLIFAGKPSLPDLIAAIHDATPGSGAGLGNDTYYVDDRRTVVVENSDGGIDSVVASIGYQLPSNVENLTLTGAAIWGWGNSGDNDIIGNDADNKLRGGQGNDTLDGGAGHDSLTGGTGNDSLIGGSGDNTLDGGPGADTMVGGTGNDIYYVDNPGDVAIEQPGEGDDTVISSSPFFLLGANIETLMLGGAGDFIGWGNSSDNLIVGNDGDNQLRGGQGNDTLEGGAGRDSLTGGTGNDSLIGGSGDDTLDGGAGANTMAGGAEDDTYCVNLPGDVVTENPGEGSETVISSSSFFMLGDNIETLMLGGAGDFIGSGNSSDNLIIGNDGDNQLRGGQGGDTLDGAAGRDTLTGGTGDDVFVFHAGQADGDVLTDFLGSLGGGGDSIQLIGFGTPAGGASFVQLNPTDWQIHPAGGGATELIHLSNFAPVIPSDIHFL